MSIELNTFKSELTQARSQFCGPWKKETRALSNMLRYTKKVDEIIKNIWKHFSINQACLIAVGGYGRGELAPFSDIDLLILTSDSASNNYLEPISTFVSSLWDVGLEAGQSVRTVKESIKLAQTDSTVSTNLLEIRYLAGEKDLFYQLQKERRDNIDSHNFTRAKLLELQKRHARYQNTPYNLEPNIKESPGGLRDIQTIKWICAQFYASLNWQKTLASELLTTEETSQLKRHEAKLKTLRGHLHISAGRCEDRLIFDLQSKVATTFGFANEGNRRASERLMQSYFNSAKVIYQILEMFLASIELKLLARSNDLKFDQFKKKLWIHRVNPCFLEFRGLLDFENKEKLQKDPFLILECFKAFQETPGVSGFSPETTRIIWNSRKLISDNFIKKEKVKKEFLNIFKREQKVVQTLTLMHRLGILGRMLPVFRKIVGQMQHDLFHVYTVDQHTLQVMANLERFTKIEHTHEFPLCSELITLVRPYQLYLAALFHDIAKGRGGDHSVLGELEVKKFAGSYNLGTRETELICFLVREHLAMSSVAQKQDVDDQRTITRFAAKVLSRENLINLYLLTVADIRGTSPKVWNNWKAKLLTSLFYKTNNYLLKKEEGEEISSANAQAEKNRKLDNINGHAGEEIKKYLNLSYFLRHEKEEIVWHSELLYKNYLTEKYIVFFKTTEDSIGLKVVVYGKDREDLFADILGYFQYRGFGVLDAKLNTTNHGYVLDTFLIDQSVMLNEDILRVQKACEYEFVQVLNNEREISVPEYAIKLSRRQRNFPLTPRIELIPDEKEEFYILNITSTDNPGLLYKVATVLASYKISIHSAKISTLGEKVEDVFLVKREKLLSEMETISIETELMKNLST
ncbi:[protein-PII] uridylyltransferase [Betaproteobacteria bacterium]|nr:[protein-PII] uridylyltransferase [Betaproteobacteria bacterium]